jgi:hypothetical protein
MRPDDVSPRTWTRLVTAARRLADATNPGAERAILGALLEVYYLAVRDAVAYVSEHFREFRS